MENTPYTGQQSWRTAGDFQLTKFAGAGIEIRREKFHSRSFDRDDFLVLVANDGAFVTQQSDRTTLCNPGSAVLLDTSKPFIYHQSAFMSGISLNIPRSVVNSLSIDLESNAGSEIPLNFGIGAVCQAALQATASEAADMQERDFVRSLEIVIETIVSAVRSEELGEQSTSRARLVSRVYDFIELNYRDMKLNTQAIAEDLGVSKRYLFDLFSDKPQTVNEAIISRRLRRAEQLLSSRSTRHLTISQVAYSCGFSSASHFSTRFSQAFGVPPNEYRSIRTSSQ